MDWLPRFAKQYGIIGILGLALLILAAQNADVLPLAQALMRPPPLPASPTAQQMDWHLDQTKEIQQQLRQMNDRLDRNHETQARGFRMVCFALARTDEARRDCAKIE